MIDNNIEIYISAIDGDQIKLGIVAPPEVNILRKEVYAAVQESNREAAKSHTDLNTLRNLMKPGKK